MNYLLVLFRDFPFCGKKEDAGSQNSGLTSCWRQHEVSPNGKLQGEAILQIGCKSVRPHPSWVVVDRGAGKITWWLWILRVGLGREWKDGNWQHTYNRSGRWVIIHHRSRVQMDIQKNPKERERWKKKKYCSDVFQVSIKYTYALNASPRWLIHTRTALHFASYIIHCTSSLSPLRS